MDITEVRIKIVGEDNDRLRAFCSITFDNIFVVRDLKIIGGRNGILVAMPSRKLMDRCLQCGFKNILTANYCNNCGRALDSNRVSRNADGKFKTCSDIVYPINTACRIVIQDKVLEAYHKELELSKLPGYVCRYEYRDN